MSIRPPISATILNVDDNEASLYVKTRVLRRAGFEVIEADRGSLVLSLIATHQPDLVLLDVNLGDASGYDITRAIKNHPDHASTIVVQISASFVERADRMKGFEAGADSYFTEPIEAEELVANVSALLRLRKVEDELRRSSIEWQKTFEAVHDGVAIVQETLVISRCNPAFFELTGAESVGASITDILLPENSGALRQLFTESSATRRGTSMDLQLRGRSLRLSIDPVLDPFGQVTHYACILSDVTSEREIAALNDQLRQTVENLKRAKEAGDAASRAKDDFLAMVSHELRTPMTSIVGWAQMLMMFGRDQQSTKEAAQAILSAAKAQAELVEDLLDLSRITTGKLRLKTEDVELSEVVEAAIQTVLPAAAGKRIEITPHIHSVHVFGDKSRLQQVMWNLLSNAVKFTPDEGRIEVRLEKKGPRAIVSVRDSGQGIEPEFLPAVFDRFSQAEHVKKRTVGGLGLGLAIVRHIVELHGGEVTAESEGKGMGATFRFMLPIATAPQRAASQQHALPHLDGRRILVVDDTKDALNMFVSFLRAAGATVFPASSMREALIVAARETIDAVVTDLAMPDGDGLELIAALRAQASHQTLAVVAMTALGSAMREASMKAGANAFMEKPVEPSDLVRVLAEL
jgi:signal transduction histidine kinase